MADCGGGSWCCNPHSIDPVCCSGPNNLFQLGEARIKTSLRLAPNFNYPSGQGTTSHATQSMAKPITLSSMRATTSHTAKSMVKPTRSTSMTAALDTSTQRIMTPTRTAHTIPAAAVPSRATSSKKNISMKVGAGAGVPLGTAAFAALVYIIYFQHKKSRSKASEPTRITGAEEENDCSITRLSQVSANEYQTVGYQPSELPAQREPIELFDTERRELNVNLPK